MSQKKVEQHKQEKANRKKLMKKAKAKHIVAVICGWVIVAAIVVWAGIGVYTYYKSNVTYETIYTDVTPLTDYISSVSAD